MKIVLNCTETKKAMEIAKSMGLRITNMQNGDDRGFKDGYFSMNNNQLEITMFQSSVLRLMDKLHGDLIEAKKIKDIVNDISIFTFLRKFEESRRTSESTTDIGSFLHNEYLRDKTDCIRIMDLTKIHEANPCEWRGTTSDDKTIYIKYEYGNLIVKVGNVNNISSLKTIFEKSIDVSGVADSLSTRKLIEILKQEKLILA